MDFTIKQQSVMKNYLLGFGVLFLFMGASPQQKNTAQQIKWLTVEEVLIKIEKSPRKIFVDTYTRWCTWCKLMDRTTFKNQKVVAYVNQNYYAIKLNAEGNKEINFRGTTLTEKQLASSFNVTGFPTIVLIDEKFESISPMPGYRKSAGFLRMLKQYNK